MPAHHRDKHTVHQDLEIAAALTAAAVTLAGSATAYPSLEAAGDAAASVSARMLELVTTGALQRG